MHEDEARVADHAAMRWMSFRWHRLVTFILVALVLAGGTCPALYGEIVPHEHLFVGGAPPANWQHHTHENPLQAFFGTPGGQGDADEPFSPEVLLPSPGSSLRAGRVVSVYTGTTVLVVTAVEMGAILTLPATIDLPDRGLRIWQLRLAFPVSIFDDPPLPPPRAS